MHEAGGSCSPGVSVSQIRARLERSIFIDKPTSPCDPADEHGGKGVPPLSPRLEGMSTIRKRSSNVERPPVAPKPRNKVIGLQQQPMTPPSLDGAALNRINGRITSLASSISTEYDGLNSSSHSVRNSFVSVERSVVDGEAGCSKAVSNVKSAAAHFDSLISSGLIGGPGGIAREIGHSNTLLSPESNVILRPASGTSWSDIRNEASSMSSDAETNSYNDLSDLEDEETLIYKDLSFDDSDSIRPVKKTSVFGNTQLHASAIEELRRREMFRKNDLRMSDRPNMHGKTLSAGIPSDVGRLRPQLPKKSREARSQPLTVEDAESVLKMRHKSEAEMVQLPGVTANRSSELSDISVATTASTDSRQSEAAIYSTGDPAEDVRLKKLHYAALEIYTVEKKFVEQLDILAVQYPMFIREYGKAHGVDLLATQSNGQSNVISLIASQLLMLKEAHSVLLEKFTAKVANWDSREPNMAEVLKNNASFLKFCVPYLKEKKKFVDELMKQLQTNELLARATAKFEEQATNRISIIQQLDIVHQNVVRYTILLEAYKKYLVPNSHEFIECESAIKELSKVSEVVNHQMSLAAMEEKLVELYRRLEGHFNVFEANRHLLHEGELMKQSRKDIQPRYLILFSDILLICKYSRAPSLGSDVCFQPDFYQFPILGVRVKAEEHGEYETHFQLLSTKKSAVFIAKSKRERDDWVKRLNDAKREAKKLRSFSVGRRAKVVGTTWTPTNTALATATSEGVLLEKDASDNDVSPTMVHICEKYVAPWIPDPKATTCMMAGCNTKFNILNRRHHCRECGALICGNCVGHAPLRSGTNFVRQKVCPECYSKIMNSWRGSYSTNLFIPPAGGSRSKIVLPDRNEKGIVSGTVFVRNKRIGETQKWGRLIQHSDGAMVLCFYDAEFDAEPCARHVLLGFDLSSTALEEGGKLFELTHANQVKGNAISIAFRIAHARSAEQWDEALTAGLRAFWMGTANNNDVFGDKQTQS